MVSQHGAPQGYIISFDLNTSNVMVSQSLVDTAIKVYLLFKYIKCYGFTLS